MHAIWAILRDGRLLRACLSVHWRKFVIIQVVITVAKGLISQVMQLQVPLPDPPTPGRDSHTFVYLIIAFA